MKKIVSLAGLCALCLVLFGVSSCGSKVNKKELDRKIEASITSDKQPEFSEAEYEFMADYLYDNYDEIEKMDINDKDVEIVAAYGFILVGAQMEGKLSKKAQETLKKLNEKNQNSGAFQKYKDNEKAIIEALEEAEIDWSEAYEEAEAAANEEYEDLVTD